MLNDVTRRDFLQTVAGLAAAGTMAPQHAFAGADFLSASFSQAEHSDGGSRPIEQLIFPKPREIASSGGDFLLDGHVSILIPSEASEADVLLATALAHELGDRLDLHLKTERTPAITGHERLIVMGSIQNPLVRQCCAQLGMEASLEALGPESYLLRTQKNVTLVAGADERGAFYGMQSLRQLLVSEDEQHRFRGVLIRDWPDKPFRGIYLFVPGRDHIPFFKRFVKDFMALYKYNTLIMEMNACMRLDTHPELNNGWVQFGRDANYSARNYPPNAFHDMEQNSSHQDAGDGGFLEKEEVADLARWVRSHHIELVPSLPSFTHSYYLLTGHRDLAAVPQNKWPDIYCPSNLKSYSLVFEVYDEYIEVLKPRKIHIGHDELFLPIGVSPQCDDQDIGELFGKDVRMIHDHLASRGIETELWGDMLLQSVRGDKPSKKSAPDGWMYYAPGGLTPEQVERLIPKDCLIYNWFWKDEPGKQGVAQLNEAYLDKLGFQQIFGNFEPDIEHYDKRKQLTTLRGGAPSAWAATNEIGFGKDLMSTFLGCSSILWTGEVLEGKELSGRVQQMLPVVRARLSGITPPSETERSIVAADISSKFNYATLLPAFNVNLSAMRTGMVQYRNIPFDLKRSGEMRAIVVGTEGSKSTGLPRSVESIRIGEAPTSLIFLHASARPALNRMSYRLIWDQQDTADLLGWYEVTYEDGFVITLPIRYGVNILECNWDERASANDYCYGADPVPVGAASRNSLTFFAYEWINPRLGKVIREIALKGTSGFQGGSDDYDNSMGPVIASNAVLLVALSIVKKRT